MGNVSLQEACREKAKLIVITLADVEILRENTTKRADSNERVISLMADLFFLSRKVASGIDNYMRRAETEASECKTFFDHCLDYANATMHILVGRDEWPQIHYENRILGALMRDRFENHCARRREFVETLRLQLETTTEYMLQVSALKTSVGQLSAIKSAAGVKHIVMLGPCGCGKSTLGNLLLGDESEFRDEGPFEVSEGAKAQTTEVQNELHESGLFSVTDTCGSDHTEARDDEFITAMIKSLEGIGHVNCFLLMLSFPGRATPSVRALINDIFGDGVWKHVVLVLTKKSKLKDESVLAKSWEELARTVPAAGRVLPPIVYLDALQDSAVEKARHLVEDILPELEDFKCDLLRSPFDVANEQLTAIRPQLAEAMTQLDKSLLWDKIFALSILEMQQRNAWTLEADYRIDAEQLALASFPNNALLNDDRLSDAAKELLRRKTEE